MKISGKQIAGIVIAVVIMTVFANYQNFLPHRWQAFSASDKSFSALFPSKPEAEDQQVPLDAGGIAVAHTFVATPEKTASYGLTYYDDPRLATETIEEELNRARDGSIAKVQGSIIGERHLAIQGHEARDIDARATGNSLITMRLIAVGQRLYLLMVVDTARQKPDSKNIQKFFDSLKLSG